MNVYTRSPLHYCKKGLDTCQRILHPCKLLGFSIELHRKKTTVTTYAYVGIVCLQLYWISCLLYVNRLYYLFPHHVLERHCKSTLTIGGGGGGDNRA